MAKITKLEQKTFEGKPTGWKVTFDDGRTGNLNEKESEKGLREGDEVFVTEIPYTSKAGKSSILFGVHRSNGGQSPQPSQAQQSSATPPSKPTIHVGAGKSKEELKAEASIRMMEATLDGFYRDKLELAHVEPKAKEFTKILWLEIDDLFASK